MLYEEDKRVVKILLEVDVSKSMPYDIDINRGDGPFIQNNIIRTFPFSVSDVEEWVIWNVIVWGVLMIFLFSKMKFC